MIIFKQNSSIIVEIGTKTYWIIDSNVQIDLRKIHSMLKANNIAGAKIPEVVFENDIEAEIQDGLRLFITDLFSKFSHKDFEIE